jgi:hypothetical protein
VIIVHGVEVPHTSSRLKSTPFPFVPDLIAPSEIIPTEEIPWCSCAKDIKNKSTFNTSRYGKSQPKAYFLLPAHLATGELTNEKFPCQGFYRDSTIIILIWHIGTQNRPKLVEAKWFHIFVYLHLQRCELFKFIDKK